MRNAKIVTKPDDIAFSIALVCPLVKPYPRAIQLQLLCIAEFLANGRFVSLPSTVARPSDETVVSERFSAIADTVTIKTNVPVNAVLFIFIACVLSIGAGENWVSHVARIPSRHWVYSRNSSGAK